MAVPPVANPHRELDPRYRWQPIRFAAEVKLLLLARDVPKPSGTEADRARFKAETTRFRLALYEIVPAVTGRAAAAQPSTEPSATDPLRLANITVIGDLDLTYATVSRPVEMRNCCFRGKILFSHCEFEEALDLAGSRFEGEVDLHYCEFADVVDFTGCQFLATFDSGDSTESFTTYKKDLIANRAHFHQAAGFNGARAGGSIYLNEAKFLRASAACPDGPFNSAVDFTGVRCENTFECIDAVFRGGVCFNAAECGSGIFQGAQFTHDEGTIIFRGATFAKGLRFYPPEPEAGGRPRPTTFRGGVDFRNVVVRRGHAIFQAVRCESKERLVDFTGSCFDWLLDFSGAGFAGPVSFRGMKCAGDALFNRAEFAGADTGHLWDVDFRYASFDGDLRFQQAHCRGIIDLGQTQIARKLHLEGAEFRDDVKLYDADIGTIVIRSRGTAAPIDNPATLAEKLLPFRGGGLDLVGCQFDRFHGGPDEKVAWELACRFLQHQKTDRFSRDPYLQLEKFYRAEGNRSRAEEILLRSHQDELANARESRGSSKWSWPRRCWESVLSATTGWGLQKVRLVWLSVIVWLVALAALWLQEDSLRHVSTTETVAKLTTASGSIAVERADSGNTPIGQDLAMFSLDALLPVDLGVESQWEPATVLARIVVLGLVGWQAFVIGVLLVPYVTGLFEKKD